MIAVRAANGSLVLEGGLPEGSIAYVDADWVPAGGGAAPALVVAADGAVTWSGRPGAAPLGALSREGAAGLVLEALARAAAEAAGEVPAGLVSVPGRGIVARWIRETLGTDGGTHGRPRVVVDTTADAETLRSATAAVEDLGTVVLAAGAGERTISFDFYPDVHVRGLRILGVAPRLENVLRDAPADAGRLDQAVREAECLVRDGQPAPRGACLYRLEP